MCLIYTASYALMHIVHRCVCLILFLACIIEQVTKYESEDRAVAAMKKFVESKIKIAV
jgi:hypothetical protein